MGTVARRWRHITAARMVPGHRSLPGREGLRIKASPLHHRARANYNTGNKMNLETPVSVGVKKANKCGTKDNFPPAVPFAKRKGKQ